MFVPDNEFVRRLTMMAVAVALLVAVLLATPPVIQSEPNFEDLWIWEDSFGRSVLPSRILSDDKEQALLHLRSGAGQVNHRTLQQTPESVCTNYNKALAGIMTCNCSRALATDVRVLCEFLAPQCSTTENGTACFDGTTDSYIDENQQPFAVTSCLNITTSPDLELTCIQVFPVVAGNFSRIANCTATLNGELCNYCHQCGNGTIQLDCCNVVPDKKQSACGLVSTNGVALANFDFVDPKGPNAGKCKGSYGYSAANKHFRFATVASLAIIGMLFIGR